MDNLKERFLKIYANVPLGLRSEIVCVVEHETVDKPISWDAAFIEIENDTPLSKNILKKLEIIGLI